MARRRKKKVGLPTAALIEVLSLFTLVAVAQPNWTSDFLNAWIEQAARVSPRSDVRSQHDLPPMASTSDRNPGSSIDFPGLNLVASGARHSGWGNSESATRVARYGDQGFPRTENWNPDYPAAASHLPANY